jgi:hypothetical protein
MKSSLQSAHRDDRVQATTVNRVRTEFDLEKKSRSGPISDTIFAVSSGFLAPTSEKDRQATMEKDIKETLDPFNK